MDYRAFESRLLDTIFTTEVQLNPATIAFLYKLSVQEASELLQQAAVNGLLNIESDDEGNILYIYPHRVKLNGQTPPTNAAAAAKLRESTALVRAGSTALVQTPESPPPIIDMIEAAGGTPPPEPIPSPRSTDATATAASGAGAQTMRCPFCSEVIIVGAKKCKHCHEYLDYTIREVQSLRSQQSQMQQQLQVNTALSPIVQQQAAMAHWNSTTPTQAAVLSFFVPGLGQMCSGRVPAGLLWMMFTCLGYVCFIVPGIVLHILCVINAARHPRQLT